MKRASVSLLISLVAVAGCADTNGEREDAGSGGETEQPPVVDGGDYLAFRPCDFDTVVYPAPEFGGDTGVLVVRDADETGCYLTLRFAERDGNSGEIMQMVATGDELDVYDIYGFMVVTIDFTCNANSTGICRADQGTADVVRFDATPQDLDGDTLSGKAFRLDIDAQGTKPGNVARIVTTIEGVFP